MKQSVKDAFRGFSARFEGITRWMYLDVRGLVTTGVGNLIDATGEGGAPELPAMYLPWLRADGSPAGPDEIRAAWRKVKDAQSLRMLGGGTFIQLTALRLAPEAVDALVSGRREETWTHLVHRFPGAESWPADAQLAVLSIAWAAGAGWHAPHFDAAAAQEDFVGMAHEAWLEDSHNPGLHPRNLANQSLLMNAAAVGKQGLNPDELYYPRVLGAPTT